MTFGLVNQVKARTRSVQLDRVALQSINPVPSPKGHSHPYPGKRTSSLGIGLENIEPSSSPSIQPIRRYRSMLEVEDPPIIKPVEPLNFDEFYPGERNGPSKMTDLLPSATEQRRDGGFEESERNEVVPLDESCQPSSSARASTQAFAFSRFSFS